MRIDKNTAKLLVMFLVTVDTRPIALDYMLDKSNSVTLFNYLEQLIAELDNYGNDKRESIGVSLPERIEKALNQLNREKSTTRGGRRYYSDKQEQEQESNYLTDIGGDLW